jgi:hypothetical protein
MTQISGQLRTVTDLTQRDIVLGFLLAVDNLLLPADVAVVPGRYEARPLNERESAAVLLQVIRHCLGAISDPDTFPGSHGYGLPDWLIAEQPNAPLFTLFDRLTDEPSDAWRELADELQSPTWYLFDELNQFYQSLAKAAGRTPAAPVQAFQALPDRIAYETEAIAVGGAAPLAARSSPIRRRPSEIEDLARRALRYEDDNISELAWRHIRFDFPLIVPRKKGNVLNTYGVLIGAELGFGGPMPKVMWKNEEAVLELLVPPAIRKDRPWRPCDQTFFHSVKQATTAATDLLRSYGFSEEKLTHFQNPQLHLRGLLPPTPVEGASIGLPLALEILRRTLDLPTPDWVASGALDESGRIQPLENDVLVAKWQAVRSDGLKQGLLAAGAKQEIPSDQLRLLGEENRTLRDAAAALWETDWDERINELKSDWYGRRGFIPGWTQEDWSDAAQVGGRPIIVETEQAEKIATFFQARGHDFGFLGGASKTGKTWIARQVQRRLKDSGKWRVDIVSVQPLRQPTTTELRDAIRQTLSSGPTRCPRRLVIIDGLESNERLDDFEHAMRNQAASAGVSILAVARALPWTAQKPWVTEDCTSFQSIDRDAVKEFVEKVFVQFPELENARALSGAIRNYARRDLWWMLHLHAFAAETTASSHAELVRRFLESRLPMPISELELDLLKNVAAMSLCFAFVPDAQIPKEPETVRAALRSLGATRVQGSGWIIDSQATAYALLGAEVANGNLIASEEVAARVSPVHVKSVLMPAVESALNPATVGQDTASVLTILLRLREHNPRALAQVLELSPVPEKLHQWAENLTKAVQLASVIDVLAPHLDSQKLHDLVRLLVSLILNDWNKLDCSGLALCIRVLRHERVHIDDTHKPIGSVKQPGWGRLMLALEDEGLGKVLERPAKSERKLGLVEELWRTYDDNAHHGLAKYARKLLPAGPPYGVQDYLLAHRLIVVMKHIAAAHDTAEAQRGLNHVKNECAKIANWEIPKESDPTIDQILLRCTVRRALLLDGGNWSTLADEISPDLHAGVERSTLPQLCTGLSALAQESRPFATRVLDGIGSTWLAQLLARHTCSIGEIATLLGTLGNTHAIFAYNMLYENKKPRGNLMRVLAHRIHEAGDAKGAGRILHAARKIDELFGNIHDGFAHELCTLIGRDFLEYSLRHDSRVSVLFHLIQGYFSTETSLTEQAWETVCDIVADTIKDTLRQWAPQLALLMVESQQVGEKFVERLVARLPRNRVFAGMTEAYSVEGLEHFHRLARVYSRVSDPDTVPLAVQFAREYTSRSGKIVPSLSREDRPDVVLRAIRAVGDTLRRAGATDTAGHILAKQNKQAKLEALRNSPAGDVATTLHLWRQINDDDAAKFVRWEATQGILLDKLRRTITQPHLGVDLVTAVEEARRGDGRALLELFKNNEPVWTAFLEELAYDQNPVTQGYAFLKLCRLGAEPEPNLRFRIYGKVWLPKIETLTSPAAIVALLRASAAWDEQWGFEAAAAVNVGRMQRRLAQGCSADLDNAAALIGTLHALRRTEAASALARTVATITDVQERSSLQAWQYLLPVLTAIAPEDAKRLGNGVADRAARAVNNLYILDEEPFWRSIGWIAYSCRQSGSDALRIVAQPATFSALLDRGTRLWSATWLGEADWATQARNAAWQEIFKARTCSPDMKIPALVALSHLNNLEPVVHGARHYWSGRPSLAPTPLINVLLQASRTDERLAGLFAPHVPEIRQELDQPYNRADFFADQSRIMLPKA